MCMQLNRFCVVCFTLRCCIYVFTDIFGSLNFHKTRVQISNYQNTFLHQPNSMTMRHTYGVRCNASSRIRLSTPLTRPSSVALSDALFSIYSIEFNYACYSITSYSAPHFDLNIIFLHFPWSPSTRVYWHIFASFLACDTNNTPLQIDKNVSIACGFKTNSRAKWHTHTENDSMFFSWTDSGISKREILSDFSWTQHHFNWNISSSAGPIRVPSVSN